jgi:chromosomal replication initiator protein
MLELLKESWSNVQAALRKAAGDAAYDAWLGELRPLLLERGVVYVEAKSRMVRDRVQRLFRPLLQEVLSKEIGTGVQIELQEAHQGREIEQLEVSPQHPIVDDANKTAWLVLRNLATGRPLPGVRFLFHGPSGVGKTFLLRSFRDAVGAVTFALPDLLRAFQAVHHDKRVAAFQQELATPAILVLDEMHRVGGKPRLQSFLRELLDRREQSGKPTVMASRWHPKEIHALDDALCAAMMGGFVAKIDPPGPIGRLRYLRALEGAPSRNGRAAAIEGLAQRVSGTFPELRAAWARSRDAGLPRRYLELIDPARTFARVRDRVCERLGVAAQDLLGKGQSRQLSLARKVLAFLCVQEGLSRAEVGRFLSARTRAAVSYMTRSLTVDMANKPQVRAMVEGLL